MLNLNFGFVTQHNLVFRSWWIQTACFSSCKFEDRFCSFQSLSVFSCQLILTPLIMFQLCHLHQNQLLEILLCCPLPEVLCPGNSRDSVATVGPVTQWSSLSSFSGLPEGSLPLNSPPFFLLKVPHYLQCQLPVNYLCNYHWPPAKPLDGTCPPPSLLFLVPSLSCVRVCVLCCVVSFSFFSLKICTFGFLVF